MGAAKTPPGPSLYPNCGGLDAYKRHLTEGTATCAACREAARVGEAAYRKYRYLHGPRKVSPVGTRRRVQALVAIGHTMKDLAAALDPPISDTALQKVMKREFVYREKAAQIAALYDQLWETPGGSVKSRRRALKFGWLPPMAWDDERLDDPDYVPLEQVLRDWDEALAIHREWVKAERKRLARAARTAEQIERDRAAKRGRRQRPELAAQTQAA